MTHPALNITATVPWWVSDLLSDPTEQRRFWITKGLGAGGTYGSAIWHYTLCWINRQSPISWFVAPTYQQAQDAAIPAFTETMQSVFGQQEGVDFSVISGNRPRIRLHKTRQEIHFKSARNPETLVAANVSHITGTEPGLWARMAYEKSSARLRCPKAARHQWLLEGTPEGKENWYAEEADFPEGIDEGRNYRRVTLWTADNPALGPDYIKNLEQTYSYDPGKLESYLYGRFVPFIKGTAYWEFRHSRNVTLDVKLSPHLPILLCFDFNRSPLAWVIMQRQPFTARDGSLRYRFVVLKETTGNARGLLDACAEVIHALPPNIWGKVPIEIHGDPAGYAEHYNAPKSGFDTIYENLKTVYQRVEIRAARSAPTIKDRLERHNALLAYELLKVGAWNRNTIASHEQTALKNGTWKIEKPQHDTWTHYADAISYPLFELTRHENLERPDRKRIHGLSKQI